MQCLEDLAYTSGELTQRINIPSEGQGRVIGNDLQMAHGLEIVEQKAQVKVNVITLKKARSEWQMVKQPRARSCLR